MSESEEVVKDLKVIVSLVDVSTDEIFETKEMEVKDGDDGYAVERKVRRMLMDMLVPDNDRFMQLPSVQETAVPKKETASTRVTNSQLKKRTDTHADVIQAMIRTLHSRGLMSEAMMRTLTGKMDES